MARYNDPKTGKTREAKNAKELVAKTAHKEPTTKKSVAKVPKSEKTS